MNQEVHMPAERLTMRKIREVFRLKFECELSNRKIAESCLIARSTVAEYLFRFQQASLNWPLPEGMDDVRRQLRITQQRDHLLDRRRNIRVVVI